MRVRVKDPNPKPKENEDDYYCAICTPEGSECPGNGPDASDRVEDKDTSDWFQTKDTEEDEKEEAPPAEESDWDADLEEAPDYHAIVPTVRSRQARQPTKVLLFSSRKHPAGWLAGVRPSLAPLTRPLKQKYRTRRRRV